MGILGSRLAFVDRRNRLRVQCCYDECNARCYDERLEQECSRWYRIGHFQFNSWLVGGVCL